MSDTVDVYNQEQITAALLALIAALEDVVLIQIDTPAVPSE